MTQIQGENRLLFWNGKNLRATIFCGINLIITGHHLITRNNYEKWRLYKNDI